MKVALSVWKDYMSTVFDAADNLLIVEIDEAKKQKRTLIKFNTPDILGRVLQLMDQKVNILICGAISRQFQSAIKSAGIEIYPFVRGPVDDVISAYQKGLINHAVFALPGCRKHGFAGNRQSNHRRRCGRP
ncbi:MAG: Dinitrogenase iron-molybdenum cofactor [Smithella sp. PtaU1.Bin162]|nr:MAG: Dinitrogenase iron-molybdenum cofactor [Smithella sp. PtaU1.Bin162]